MLAVLASLLATAHAQTGSETVLYTFTGGSDGSNPIVGLIQDANGNLYDATPYGANTGFGVVFKFAP